MKHLNPAGRGAGILATAGLLLGLAAVGPARAHHSFAMFDNEHQIKIAGQVSKFEWTNPHVYLFLKGGEAGKEPRSWTIEGASPGILNRVGWKFNLVRTGDQVTLIIAPLRSGEPGGLLKEITLSDGRVLNNGGFAGPALIH